MNDKIITHTVLGKAIKYAYSLKGVDIDIYTSTNVALQVLSFFGFESRVVSNLLEQDDLMIMYMLEDFGLVKSEFEETYVGRKDRDWRINYFVMNKEKILEYSTSQFKEGSISPSVYDTILEGEWQRK